MSVPFSRRHIAGVLAVLSAVVAAMAVLLGVAGGAVKGDTGQNTTLSLNASPTTVNTGSTTSLFGELAQENGSGTQGKRVVLQQKPHGSPAGDFQAVPRQPAEGLLTGDGGEFSLLSVQPSANTDYRVRCVEGSNTTTSRTVELGVKVYVGLNVLRKHIKSGNDATLSGLVSPVPSQGSLRLTIKRDGQKFTRRHPRQLRLSPQENGQGKVHGEPRPAPRPTASSILWATRA